MTDTIADTLDQWLGLGGQPVTVTLPATEQAVVLFVGDDDMPIIVKDDMSTEQLQFAIDGPIAQAVFAARLRAIADMLDV